MLKEIDSEFGGSCPCFHSDDKRFYGHCWRTRHEDCACEFSGVHYKKVADKKEAEQIAKWISDSYFTDCAVVLDK